MVASSWLQDGYPEKVPNKISMDLLVAYYDLLLAYPLPADHH